MVVMAKQHSTAISTYGGWDPRFLFGNGFFFTVPQLTFFGTDPVEIRHRIHNVKFCYTIIEKYIIFQYSQ